ncbi:uncharacterized protein FOMMEDRAFT_169427 [Fomitiporia mediterranea MF3/22]|uniref:uncharacterized protein n=1 Tax=Fomitiporia mediterranea (strain MF3/22) TaxID=694068 RepID=UPI0004407E04|nr:uncharacterized protein FOMMEDRAFT_169427 [Fomitiporia mediterranea MF3/22]EJD01275.1 hypothetical protein FOMMEDRAFT_169427 [Fomitiporia mediterranea MF3/22]
MACPRTYPAMTISYDPYSYYCPPTGDDDRFLHISRGAARPASSCDPRRASIWSTSSICSDGSSLDLDDRAHDFDDDDDLLVTPISPAESSSSRTSWSSMASSSSSTSRCSATAQEPSERFRRTSSGKPRGPRPLPALPTSQPSSPCSMPSSLPTTLPVKVTPPLRLSLKFVAPPPSYEEAISAGAQTPVSTSSQESERLRRPASYPGPFPFDAETEIDASPAEFLTSPTEETIIDWERIEEGGTRFESVARTSRSYSKKLFHTLIGRARIVAHSIIPTCLNQKGDLLRMPNASTPEAFYAPSLVRVGIRQWRSEFIGLVCDWPTPSPSRHQRSTGVFHTPDTCNTTIVANERRMPSTAHSSLFRRFITSQSQPFPFAAEAPSMELLLISFSSKIISS